MSESISDPRPRTWYYPLGKIASDDLSDALFFEQYIGSVVGNALSKNWLMPCIDEFTVSEVEFVDLGEIVPGQGFMPVVVKSLPFGA